MSILENLCGHVGHGQGRNVRLITSMLFPKAVSEEKSFNSFSFANIRLIQSFIDCMLFVFNCLVSIDNGLTLIFNCLQIDIKKTWNSTVVVPRHEALALPNYLRTTTRSPRRYIIYPKWRYNMSCTSQRVLI